MTYLRIYNGPLMKIETHPDSDKQAQILKLLQFGTVMIFIDSRMPSVVVPDHLKGDYQLRLNFDYAYEVADFRVLPDRLEASLSFNQRNFFCVIPFEAIYLIVSHSIKHGILFAQSVPIEMLEYFAAEAQREESLKSESSEPKFKVVAGKTSSTTEEAVGMDQAEQSSSKDKPAKRAHLRLVT